MNWTSSATLIVALACCVPAAAVQPPPPRSSSVAPSAQSVERWVLQLESELDHLQEDLYYERGTYPPGLEEEVEEASRSVAHFHEMLRRNRDQQHLMRDFETMDQQIHQLVDRLNQSGDRWLRRQAARIRYPDEQLHYALRAASADPRSPSREVLARHAHVLESEARNLEELVDRIGRRDEPMRDAVHDFADEAEHFHQTVERDADVEHLRQDFRDVDEAWRRVVERVNRSPYGFYLRRTAQNVNRVHNQIYQVLAATEESVQRPERVQPVERRRDRPAVEFEIPGIGRFRIPR